MKSIGALPTEERVQKMNNYQWLWYYYNLQQEKNNEVKEKNAIVDYLTFFINPDLAKAVQEQRQLEESKNAKKHNELKENETYNDDFEKEFGQYFNNKEDFIEIPNSSGMAVNETEEEFFERAMKIQEYIQYNPSNDIFKELPKAQKLHKKPVTEEEIIKYSIDKNEDVIFTSGNL